MYRAKFLITWLLSGIFWSNIPVSVKAREIVLGNSILCENRGLKTYMALATQNFNIAICFKGEDCVYQTDPLEHFYVGQDKKTNNQIFLSANYKILDGLVWTEKWEAVNKTYKYEVFQTNKQGGYSSISVFENGKMIYTERVTKYIYNCYD